ncbi:hypothetical protein QBC32DRAFT_375515 [Pseudoneurospora amorphoporcata]|uniref:Uncharacterized protein n=1 Tax=Pseudoneurospora amorphoporcata TaxID=241081 RepID=A0AAN6NRJ6_9PEZI|nr:hypothetical protein QBC32DRAFT_375515 [Pseudoneurospora amorphoporcata]
MSNDTDFRTFLQAALWAFGPGEDSFSTWSEWEIVQMEPTTLIRAFRAPGNLPTSFENLVGECGHLTRPSELQFYIQHATEMGSRQRRTHPVPLERWNFGGFRTRLQNPARAPMIAVEWEPSDATIERLLEEFEWEYGEDDFSYDHDWDDDSECSSY